MKLKFVPFRKFFKPSRLNEAKPNAAVIQDLRNLYSINRNKLNLTVSE